MLMPGSSPRSGKAENHWRRPFMRVAICEYNGYLNKL